MASPSESISLFSSHFLLLYRPKVQVRPEREKEKVGSWIKVKGKNRHILFGKIWEKFL
jgi:hypothetical protein